MGEREVFRRVQGFDLNNPGEGAASPEKGNPGGGAVGGEEQQELELELLHSSHSVGSGVCGMADS